jgi:hypothetical protein
MLLAVTDGNIMLSGRDASLCSKAKRKAFFHFTKHREYIHGTFYYTNKDITHNFLQFRAYYNYSMPIMVAVWSKA